MAHESIHFPPEDDSSNEERLAVPKTHEDWLRNVQKLEAKRDRVVAAMRERGEDPWIDPDVNFLLGKLSMAQEELTAHSVARFGEELDKDIAEF